MKPNEAQARKVLIDFVNDHNETVRWLRNQSPDEVAEALASAIATAQREALQEAREATLAAVPIKTSSHHNLGRINGRPIQVVTCDKWNDARAALETAWEELLK